MPGRFSLYPDLSVEENLRFFASVFGTTIEAEHERIAPIYSQLEPFKERRAGALSGGMKQKLALCCALVHRPEILFLDEPTTGVDAVSRREFWDLLANLKAGGLTIVVSTPYMDEANRCDRVALIQRGRLLAIDTPEAVARAFDRPLIAIRSDKRYETLLALRDYPHDQHRLSVRRIDSLHRQAHRGAGRGTATARFARSWPTEACDRRSRSSQRHRRSKTRSWHAWAATTRRTWHERRGSHRGEGSDAEVRRLHRMSTTSPSTSERARCSAFSARTARARRRRSGC